MRDFHFHPKNKNWILASSWSKCGGNEKGCYVTKDLMFSDDMGVNWRKIASYIN